MAVGDVIEFIAEEETELEQLRTKHPAVQPEAGKAPEPATQAKTPPAHVPDTGTADVRPSRTDGRVIASPAAQKLAREHEIELGGLAGSGPGGRIVLMDVQEAFQTLQAERSEAMYDFPSPSQETELLSVAERIQVRDVRKITAKNMKLSLFSQAQLPAYRSFGPVPAGDQGSAQCTGLGEAAENLLQCHHCQGLRSGPAPISHAQQCPQGKGDQNLGTSPPGSGHGLRQRPACAQGPECRYQIDPDHIG
ncbi:MAG: E3 binding domain-containing protein [Desulfohalobiaceae bacterium]|nr:E3 binding domain-containing protein [Desulfohalobiaceae bacterium]